MPEFNITFNDQATSKLLRLEKAVTLTSERLSELGTATDRTAKRLEDAEKDNFDNSKNKLYSGVADYLNKVGNDIGVSTFIGGVGGLGLGTVAGPPGSVAGAIGGAVSGAWTGLISAPLLNMPILGKAIEQYEVAKEAYEKAKRPVTKAAEAGYSDLKEQEIDLQAQLLGPGRKYYKNLQLNTVRKQQQEIRDEFGVTESQMLDYFYDNKSIWYDPHHVLPPSGQTNESNSNASSSGQEASPLMRGLSLPANYSSTGQIMGQDNLPSQAGGYASPLMRGIRAVQPTIFSSLSSAGTSELDGLTGKVDDFQKTTTDALKTVKGDLDLVNLNGWSLMRKNISDTSIKFDTEFKTSSDSALSSVSTGLTAVNTGYGAVNTAATSLFNLTGTGFGNSLLATQNYQTSGLAPLALGFGTTLPTQLGLFQTSHDTTFNQAEGKTSAAYTKMGLAAHDFFDDVGFQASQVLGGLVTGHTRSSNII